MRKKDLGNHHVGCKALALAMADDMADTEDAAGQENAKAKQDAGAGNAEDKADGNQDKILVYEGSVAIDAIKY